MRKVIFESAARDAAAHTSAAITASGYPGARLFVNVTSISGAGTVTPKVQVLDGTGTLWIDVPGAAFATLSAVTSKTLTIYPGVAETANESVSDVLSDTVRVISTVATSTVTFSVSINFIR